MDKHARRREELMARYRARRRNDKLIGVAIIIAVLLLFALA